MNDTVSPATSLFQLPQQGIFQANGPNDPLPYYYKPLIGALYRARIEQALSLLRPPYDSILEIGYGSGILLPSFLLCFTLWKVKTSHCFGHDVNSLASA